MGVDITRAFGGTDAFPATGTVPADRPARLVRRLGLSARLFLVTTAFVALAAILIFIPAVANYRNAWLADRLAAARVAVLAAEAAPGRRVPEHLARRLLDGVGALSVIAQARDDAATVSLGTAPGTLIDTVDLRGNPGVDSILGAWRILASPVDLPIRVIGPGREPFETIDVVLDEAPLRSALIHFAIRLLLSSLVIALAAAGLVFVMLQRAFVQPMRHLARNIAAFADDPESAERVIAPSGRIDEIGDAETALARMEIALAGELRHKRRLAGLGLSVSKINHELRNLLTTAQLLGDRLKGASDPVVERVAPRLVATLDRASRFCEASLAYGRAAETHPNRRLVPLAPVLEELSDLAGLSREGQVGVRIQADPGLAVDADPEQIARALANLVRNAVQALDAAPPAEEAPVVTITAHRTGAPGPGRVVIVVADNGPGLPSRARLHLFEPFQSSNRAGGTGLGLAIAAELTELNGGTLILDPTERGASFRMTLPDRPAGAGSA